MLRNFVPAEQCATLAAALGEVAGPGRRGVLAHPAIAAFARSPAILETMGAILGGEPRPVRGIFFDKTSDANWLVPWHQDLTLTLRDRVELPGFGPWSVKEGIPHVQPPAEFLARMLTLRLHLDDTDDSNGALSVLPGSHRAGRMSPEQIQSLRSETPEELICAKAGDALLMCPLVLHASRRSASDRRRRVLHLEYAASPLPSGLVWHESV